MKELTVQQWFEEIHRGLEYRKLYGLESAWAELEGLFYHVHPSNMHQGPNLIYSTGEALMSALSVPYPYVTVKARRQEFITPARLLESTDNMLIEDMRLQQEVERAVLSAYIWGRGFLKIGYDSEWGWDSAFDLGGSQPLGMSLTQFNSGGKQRIEFGNTKPGMPWVTAVLPHDIVVPWGTFDIDSAPWYAHRVLRHVDDLKADPRYQTRGLQPVMSQKDFVESYKKPSQVFRYGEEITTAIGESRNVEFCEMWEIHDRRTQKVYVVATGHKSFLREDDDLLQLQGLPLVSVGFVPRARNFWTTPDAYYLKAHQAEMSDIAIQRSKLRRVGIMKMLYAEDAFDEETLEQMTSAEVKAAVRVKGGMDLDQVVKIFQNSTYDPGLDAASENVRRDSREMTGFSRNQMGEYEQSGRRTATEVQEVSQASNLRMDRRQSVVACCYIETFKHINKIIQNYWTTPRLAEVLGPTGAQTFVPFTGPDLKGEYSYSVGFSVNGNETLQSRRQMAMNAYLQLRQDPLIDPFQLAKFMNNAFNDPEFSSVFAQGVLDGSMQMQMQLQQMSGAGQRGGVSLGQGGSGTKTSGASGRNPSSS